MKYAFVFISILAIWIAGILLVLSRGESVNLIFATVMICSVLLFIIGFKRKR